MFEHQIQPPSLRYIGKRTKGVEKRIRYLLRIRKSFYLNTLSVEDNITKEVWYIDSGGWVSIQEAESNNYKHIGHIKNLLKFLGGSQPQWYDPERPEKRSYVRRKVKRGNSF